MRCSTVGPWSSMTSVLLERGNLNNYAHRENARWRLNLCCYKPMELVYVEWMCMFVSAWIMEGTWTSSWLKSELETQLLFSQPHRAEWCCCRQPCSVTLSVVYFHPLAVQALCLPSCRGLNKSKTCVLICAVKTILFRWQDSRTIKLHVKPQLCFWLPENAQHLGKLL